VTRTAADVAHTIDGMMHAEDQDDLMKRILTTTHFML
jgi:hypothetical protein